MSSLGIFTIIFICLFLIETTASLEVYNKIYKNTKENIEFLEIYIKDSKINSVDSSIINNEKYANSMKYIAKIDFSFLFVYNFNECGLILRFSKMHKMIKEKRKELLIK